ncbi:MAG: hypothetical protein WKG00_12560 [Polyangiaceae bacterium]
MPSASSSARICTASAPGEAVRCAASRASAAARMRLQRPPTLARSRSAAGKMPSSTLRSTCAGFLPSNGRWPTSASYMRTPSAKTSVRASTSPPSICSGAM